MLKRCVLLILLLVTAPSYGAPALQPVRDLAADAVRAGCNGQPLIVMFSADYCQFCHTVRDLYLRPLLDDPSNQGLIIRELKTTSDARVTDFDGGQTTMQDLAFRYEVYLVPVVVFFGPGGSVLVDPMVGISSQDFYGAYLKTALLTAQQTVRNRPSGGPSGALPEYACD